MSQRNGFTGGLILGAILGGVVGGVVGALAASRGQNEEKASSPELNSLEDKELNEENIESARRSLETKISQLNLAIDDVRQQLSFVHTNSLNDGDRQ